MFLLPWVPLNFQSHNKRRILLGFVILVVLGLIAGRLFLMKVSTSDDKNESTENNIVGFPAPLRHNRFTEELFDRNIVRGMSSGEAEAILGKPYRYAEIMGTMWAAMS